MHGAYVGTFDEFTRDVSMTETSDDDDDDDLNCRSGVSIYGKFTFIPTRHK